MSSKTSSQQTPTLKLDRVFHATPQKLWTYWTEPAKYAKWFNPAPGIDLVVREFDARPGGKIDFDMPRPDGNKNPQSGVFHSLTPYTEIVTGAPDKSFLLTVRFEPVGASDTRMTVLVVGVPPEWHAMATKGWNAGFDKLERQIQLAAGGFVIERTFKAAPEKVWKMWTTKEGIEQWWVPSMRELGFDMHVRSMDVRVGGSFAFAMANKQQTLVNRGTYTTVQPHERLAWTWHFDIHLAPGEKPYDVPISVTLDQTPSGGTRMTFCEGPLSTPQHTQGSRDGVTRNLDMMAKALGE